MFDLLEYLKKKPLLLAPMAGVTDYPFRSFMRDMNGGILTTELVSSFALVNGNKDRTKRIAHIDSFQQPLVLIRIEFLMEVWERGKRFEWY